MDKHEQDMRRWLAGKQQFPAKKADLALLAELRAHPALHWYPTDSEGDLNGPNTAECCAVVLKLLRGDNG